MTRVLSTTVLLLALAAPSTLLGQEIVLGARAGSLGFGGEVAVGLGDRLVARGGIGFFPFDLPEITLEEFDFAVTPPDRFITAGLDFYPFGRGLRLMGGMLFRSGDIEIEAPVDPGDELGDITIDQSGFLSGGLDQDTSGPFVGIGFGKHTRGGFGFFLDLAVAFLGSGSVELSASNNILAIPGVPAELDEMEADVQEEAGSYLEYWPILSLGVKLPLGVGR